MINLSEYNKAIKYIYMIPEESCSSNIYLLDNGRTLIDAGNLSDILRRINDKFDASKIERIFLTHGHFENIGGLVDILQKTSPIIYIHNADLDGAKLDEHKLSEAVSHFKNTKIETISDGQVFNLDSYKLTVIYTPGHTAGSVCYADFDKKILFSGHTILRSDPEQWYAANVDLATGNKQMLLESVTRLLGWHFSVLMPSNTAPDLFKADEQIKATYLSIDDLGDKTEDGNLGFMHLAAQLADHRRFNEAHNLYKHILSMESSNAALLGMALTELELEKFSDSLKHFNILLEQRSDDILLEGKASALRGLKKVACRG